MIPTTKQSLASDRIQTDIAQAMNYADALDGQDRVTVLESGAERWMEPDQIRANARAIGVEHIIASMSPDMQPRPPAPMATSEFSYLAVGAP